VSLLDDATIEGGLVNVQFGQAIQTATETLSIDQAPTVTITLIDPDRTLVESGLWQQRSRLVIKDRTYILVQIEKQGASRLQVTFEQWEVYKLRQAKKYRKAFRSRIDRVTFAQSLCRESGVKFHAPEAGPAAPTVTTVRGSGSGAAAGFAKGAKVTVKGSPATANQLLALSQALDEAIRLKVSTETLIGVVMAGTQESSWNRWAKNDVGHGHFGIFQQDPTIYSQSGHWDPAQDVHEFLVGPRTWDWKTGKPVTDVPKAGSFMALMRGYTGANRTIGEVIEQTQRSGENPTTTYDKWRDEAEATVTAYNSPGRTNTHTALLRNDKMEFSRGQPGHPETSWDTLQGLATDIGFRCFMVGDTVWFVSDDWLFATPPIATLREGDGIANAITWTLDVGKSRDECDVDVNDLWVYSPGVAVQVEGEGPAEGKWLLAEWTRNLLRPTATVRLVKPGATLPEPVGDQSGNGYKAPRYGPGNTERATKTDQNTDPQTGTTFSARQMVTNALTNWYRNHRGQCVYTQGHERWDGIVNKRKPPDFPRYADCSSGSTWALWLAWLVYPDVVSDPSENGWSSGWTGSMIKTGQVRTASNALPGDCVFYGGGYNATTHVAVMVARIGGKPWVIGMGSPGGPSYVPYDYRSDVVGWRSYIQDSS
jgi:hypothetical protein